MSVCHYENEYEKSDAIKWGIFCDGDGLAKMTGGDFEIGFLGCGRFLSVTADESNVN